MVSLDDGAEYENSDTDPVNMMHLGHLSFKTLSLARSPPSSSNNCIDLSTFTIILMFGLKIRYDKFYHLT